MDTTYLCEEDNLHLRELTLACLMYILYLTCAMNRTYPCDEWNLPMWEMPLTCVILKTRGGGGVLSLEKGTDSGPSAVELWLSRANNAKKGGLSSHYR